MTLEQWLYEIGCTKVEAVAGRVYGHRGLFLFNFAPERWPFIKERMMQHTEWLKAAPIAYVDLSPIHYMPN